MTRTSAPVEPVAVSLCDGSAFRIIPADDGAGRIVSCLRDMMCLEKAPAAAGATVNIEVACGAAGPRAGDPPGTAGELADAAIHLDQPALDCRVFLASQWRLRCVLSAYGDEIAFRARVVALSLVLARLVERNGGLLLHAAMIETNNVAALLAGPGGMGKSTAAGRVPSAWAARSDDMALVVRDSAGRWWAHPWPTWSVFYPGPGWGTWDVTRGSRLGGIFFLDRKPVVGRDRLSVPRAFGALRYRAWECTWNVLIGKADDAARTMHLQQFDNALALAREIPCRRLYVSLRNAFWHDIAGLPPFAADGTEGRS